MADFSCLRWRLLETLMNRLLLWIILLVYYVVFLIVVAVRSHRLDNTKESRVVNIIFPQFRKDNKITLSQSIFLGRVFAVTIPIIMLLQGIPVIRDISHNQFVQEMVTYRRSEFDESDLFANGRVTVNNGKEDIELKLPSDWTEEEFPYGLFEGTVIYSKESKVILLFLSQ